MITGAFVLPVVTVGITDAELKAMYGNHGRYVWKVANVIYPLVRQGYVLKYDANAAVRDAARSNVAR